MSYPVPGLARGIEILRLLEAAPQLTLEEIARRTGFPKASVFRLMETLTALDLVGRDTTTKSFRPLARLTSTAPADTAFETQLADALDRLARQTGQTAEWYIPLEEGLAMVQRAEPPRSELQVRARIGFTRAWNAEMDAVASAGRAWREKPPKTFSKLWVYGESGRHVAMKAAQARRRQAEARDRGFACDNFYNTNGVKRVAAVVLDGVRMRGVLALAQCFTPQAAGRERQCLERLLAAATGLNRNNPFNYTLGDLN